MTAPQPAIGALRRRIRIETPVYAGDGGGGAVAGWSELATVWASVAEKPGREGLQEDRPRADKLYEVTLRYRSDVTAEARLIFEGRALQILTLRDLDGRKCWLIADCRSES